MTYEQIHNLFKQRYNQSSWKQFLGETFTNTRLLAQPEMLTGIDSNVASQVQKLGHITLNENGIERQIAVYDVTLAQGIILERNRVGLRNLLRKYWKDIDAAFITYHRPESPKWRFTYVSELTGYDADGEVQQIQTEPKRYTYVLGEGESTRTAAERFTIIANKGRQVTLDDVKEAFSVEKLSKAFFDEYKKQYDIFCNFMVSKPNIRQTIFNGDEKSIRDFNKKLLGRMVFLYFIQKKGWLGVPVNEEWGKGDFNFLTNLFKNTQNPGLFYSEVLSKLFFDTLNKKRQNDLVELVQGELCRIPYLNGGLFEEDDKKHRDLIFDAKLFENLFNFFNQYNFTIYEDDPNDHTVAVDPEMLGHIFENLLEDNKDKGAFYTPKEIVHYMCQESLIEYLCTALNVESEEEERKALTKLLKEKEVEEILKPEIENIHKALDTVKICDPAIGSGAFPMGLLHEIFTAKQTLHIFEYGNTKTFDASAVKLNIIQNSIYGVDIEKGAVDIARLRFWLSLIVDEEKPKALPNLDYKIVVGNSLVSKLGDDVIDIDWNLKDSVGKADEYVQKLKRALAELTRKQKYYFEADDKSQLKAEIRNLKIEILINQLSFNKERYANHNNIKVDMGFGLKPAEIKKNLEIKLQLAGFDNTLKDLNKLKDKSNAALHFFDWKLDFPEVLNPLIADKYGFDIVIGNPPYVQLQKMGAMTTILEKAGYESFERTGDIYCLFYELGNNLLKKDGSLNYITSNKWMRAGYGESLRKYFLAHTDPKILLDFGGVKVFENATVDVNILLFKKGKYTNHTTACLFKSDFKLNSDISVYVRQNAVTLQELSPESGWVILSQTELNIKQKIEKVGKPLKNWDIQIYRGILTGFNEAFIIDGKTKDALIAKSPKNAEIIRPILRGRDIKKYKAEFADLWLIATHNGIKDKNIPPINVEKDYPSVFEHLQQYQSALEKRLDKGDHWTNLRNCAYWQEFEKEKIIYPETTVRRGEFVFDREKKYLDKTCFMIIGLNLKYISALLSSQLFTFYMEDKMRALGKKSIQYSKQFIEQVPIIPIAQESQKPFEILVEYVLWLKASESLLTEAKDLIMCRFFEEMIDAAVFELYFEESLKKHEKDVLVFLKEIPALPSEASGQAILEHIRQIFNQYYQPNHPLNQRLYYIDSVPEVRVILGKA